VYVVTKVTGDSKLQSAVLEDLSDAHRYRRWLADLAWPHLGEHPVEIGSGTGDYALEWATRVPRFTATEADVERFEALRERFANHDVIAVRYLLLAEDLVGYELEPHAEDASTVSGGSDRRHSAAVAVNVLEHIPDHVGALRAIGRLVRPGGSVILIVPAFPSAMSRFDLAIGHQRRYTRRSLAAALTAAGLTVQELRYINPLGLLSWYVTVKALRLTPRNGPALRLYDRMVVPLARWADRMSMPFGQSVFAVARVPGGAPSG
jgi:SAM-dependent methyltransferase